ncbi:MAG: cytochrome B6 [Desulfuromonadales bacterium GWD2_54_10]|nr:MAG: cytochrome B6 [Desulfuromonadales bacterium GWD2_54_10]
MENVPQSRRTFIAKVALLFGSAILLRRYLTPSLPVRRTVLVSVPVSDIPPQGALVYRDQRLALLRDSSGFYALSLVCTHLGCTVTVSSGHLSCPCHGSEFDRQGRVLKGPADKPLLRLKVEERDGKVEVLV